MKRVVPLLLLAFALTARSEFTLQPESPGLGERATLSLSQAPEDSTHWPTGRGIVLSRVDDTTFSVLPVRVGELWVEAEGDTLFWTVAGTIENAVIERLRPIKPGEPIGPNWWPTALLLLLIASPLLFLLYRLLRRPRRRAAFELPAEPPQLAALRDLARIEASDWLTRGETERWYVEASQVLRRYIAGRYRVPALDWTSQETVARLLASGYRHEDISSVEPLLASADGVKFAGARPSQHSAEEWLRAIREFVERSAIEILYSTPEALRAAERMR